MIMLYTQGAGAGAQSFQTAYFDIAAAVLDVDYTILHEGHTAYTEEEDAYMLALQITADGLQYVTNLQTLDNMIKAPDWDPAQPWAATAVQIGVKPADWELHWRDKYYIKSDVFYLQPSAVWDASTQYYTLDSVKLQRIFWTLGGNFFGISHYYSYNSGYNFTRQQNSVLYPADYVSYSPQDERTAYYWRKNGAEGTQLGNGNYIAQEWENIDKTQPHQVKIGMQFITLDYDDRSYTGVIVVKFGADGVPQAAQLSAISNVFWQGKAPHTNFGPSTSYNAGTGTYSDTSQPVDITPIAVPLTISSYGAGMHISALLDGNISTLFSELWASTSFFSKWKNIRYDPMSAILSLHKLPSLQFAGTGFPSLSIAMTRLNVPNSTAGARVQDLYLGSISMPEYYGSRLDYAPHTSANIFLPFCGEYPLDITDVQGGYLELTYRIDIATGDCIAFLMGTDRRGLRTVSKSYKGNCAYRIPVSGSDSGGAGMLSGLMSMLGGAVNLAAKNIPTGVMGIASGVVELATAKENYSTTAIQGSAAALGIMTPYVKIYRDVQQRPDNYEIITGDTAAAGGTVRATADGFQISGFAQYSGVKLVIDATEAEKQEIESLLRAGVFV